ncbi:MAG TPA: hypothetical protein VI701_04180 [Anaerolineales bacterium]|nr:hypothetical protein [Anaerolineales bacterium]
MDSDKRMTLEQAVALVHWGVDRELSLIAATVIVTAERIVPRVERADISVPSVRAGVEARGAPGRAPAVPCIPLDEMALLRYTDVAETPELAAGLAESNDGRPLGAVVYNSHPFLKVVC